MPSKTESAKPKGAEKKSIRLVCIADTHGFHRKLDLPAGDILMHAGDLDGCSVEAIDDFNAWLGTLPFRHKLVIAGNHDLLFDRKPRLARAHLTQAIYLQDSGVGLEGLNFGGSPVGRRSFRSSAPWPLRTTGEPHRGTDQGNVGEGLGEVADQAPGFAVVLL